VGVPEAQRRFPRSSAVGRYWLARCEGFRARTGSRDIGRIEEVRCSTAQGDAYSLVVKGHGRRVAVSVDRVLEVDPWSETVVLAPSRRLREQLGRSTVAASRMSLATATAARVTANGARRYGPAVLDQGQRAASWSGPRARHGALLAWSWAVRALIVTRTACLLAATVAGHWLGRFGALLLRVVRAVFAYVRQTIHRLGALLTEVEEKHGKGVSTLDR